jgi:hypothetical protein
VTGDLVIRSAQWPTLLEKDIFTPSFLSIQRLADPAHGEDHDSQADGEKGGHLGPENSPGPSLSENVADDHEKIAKGFR